jgi:N-acetylmuramoyl-L-alanine amidase
MISGILTSLRRPITLTTLVIFASLQAAPVRAEEEKKGLFTKIFGGKDEPPATETKKATPKAAEKPKAAPAAKPKSTPAPPKPTVAEKPKGPASTAATTTPKVPTGPGNVKNESKPSATNPWHIIDIGGRDYVTLESIRNFYNPIFGFTSFKQQGDHVWLISGKLVIKAQVGSQELLMNNMKFILSFPILSHSGKTLISRLDLVKLIDPILCPSHIQNAEKFDTVVIDAGHGGHEPGARGVYGYEKDFTLKMAQQLRTALMARGFKVVLTRSTDTFISLSGRVAIANQIPNSIFISLHFNYSEGSAVGIETWALTPQNAAATISRGGGFNANGTTGNRQDSANIALASAVHARVLSTVKVVDRGIKRAQWSVLTGCTRPGILFEGGFVTNAAECRLIASDPYQKTVSAAIADAVVNYRKALESAVARH